MNSLHYLTVQDVLWINLQITKKVQHYNYARLEEATFYQYAYGESNSLLPQAARFLQGFPKMHPFDAGNEATGFVSVLAFLKLNGQTIKLTDEAASSWYMNGKGGLSKAQEAVTSVSETDPHAHHELQPNVRAAIRWVLDHFTGTVSKLAVEGAAV